MRTPVAYPSLPHHLTIPRTRIRRQARSSAREYAARPLVWGPLEGRTAVEDRSQEKRKHIFAINGSPDFLNIVRELFQEENYNVTTTNFVPSSFDQITAVQPDALIVDIVVGEQAGWELLEQLHAGAATTGIPVVVLSTNPRLLDRAREQAERYGNHRYLDKPFDVEALLTTIQDMIGEA